MDCPTCGFEAADDANFCPICGLNLRSVREAAAAVAAESSGEPVATAEPTAEDVAAVVADVPKLQLCGRCGAPNSPQRRRCGRCGVRLDEATPAAPAAPQVRTTSRATAEASRLRVQVLVGVLVVAAVAGISVGLASSRRDRPPADGPVPEVTFDPAAHPGSPRRLEAARARASSTLAPASGIRYDAPLVLDGDRRTAWNEGVEGPGVGETITVRLRERSWVATIVVRNGYQKSDTTFLSNMRAKSVRLTTDDGSSFVITLQDDQGEQAVALPEPVLARELVFEVREVYPGERYEDLAISEISALGWSADAGDGAARSSDQSMPARMNAAPSA